MRPPIWPLPLLVVLSACSSLHVQVSVLNPEVVREMATNDRLARAIPSIMAETPTSIASFFSERRNVHGRFYYELQQAYSAEAQKYPTGSQDNQELAIAAQSLKFPDELRAAYDYWQAQMTDATRTLQSSWPAYQAATDPAERLRLRNQLVAALDEREAVQRAANSALASDVGADNLKNLLKGLSDSARASFEKTIQGVQASASEGAATQSTQLFNSGDIQNSPYAFYVAKAPEKEWAEHFDQTVGRGSFGNTDIAIKALAPGNFTIKGVSFNPADVAAAAAKVTSQTVVLAAQIAGVPVKLSGTPPQGASGGALAQSSQGLSSALAANESVDQQLAAQRDALARIAAAIVNERGAIQTGTPTQRRSSLDAIKAVYDSQASQLRITQSTQSK